LKDRKTRSNEINNFTGVSRRKWYDTSFVNIHRQQQPYI